MLVNVCHEALDGDGPHNVCKHVHVWSPRLNEQMNNVFYTDFIKPNPQTENLKAWPSQNGSNPIQSGMDPALVNPSLHSAIDQLPSCISLSIDLQRTECILYTLQKSAMFFLIILALYKVLLTDLVTYLRAILLCADEYHFCPAETHR